MKRIASSGAAGYRYQALAETLEKQIAAGKYAVGEKLPAERVLAEQVGVSYLTVRQGIDVLVRKGLVRRELGSGTYVNSVKANPIIGILFGPSLVEESAHFYRALLKALEKEIAGGPYTSRCYDGLNKSDAARPEGSLGYQQILRDSRDHPVKGFIQISVTDQRWNNKKAIKGAVRSTHGEMNRDVIIDYSIFGRDTLELCVEQGCKDIVYLRSFLNPQDDLGGLGDAAKRLKVAMPEIINLEDDGRPGDSAAHDLLCRRLHAWKKNGRRPDAIIVSDDIATRGVAIALIKAGIRIPSEVLVVTLANEGIDHHYGIPVHRHAISPTELAQKLIHVLECRMAGRPVAVPQYVAGRWITAHPPVQTRSKAGTSALFKQEVQS